MRNRFDLDSLIGTESGVPAEIRAFQNDEAIRAKKITQKAVEASNFIEEILKFKVDEYREWLESHDSEKIEAFIRKIDADKEFVEDFLDWQEIAELLSEIESPLPEGFSQKTRIITPKLFYPASKGEIGIPHPESPYIYTWIGYMIHKSRVQSFSEFRNFERSNIYRYYDLRHAKFGGGFASDGGIQTGGTLNEYYSQRSNTPPTALTDTGKQESTQHSNVEARTEGSKETYTSASSSDANTGLRVGAIQAELEADTAATSNPKNDRKCEDIYDTPQLEEEVVELILPTNSTSQIQGWGKAPVFLFALVLLLGIPIVSFLVSLVQVCIMAFP